MRIALFTLAAGLAALAPRPARACSYSPCWFGSPRVEEIELHTVSPVPRDGAFVFSTGQEASPTCLEQLAPHLAVTVTQADTAVSGELMQLAGLPTHFIWRPTALLTAGATYELQISIDNDALGPAMVELDMVCGPSPLLATFELTAGDMLATTPVPPPPVLAAGSRTWNTSMRGVSCCPGVVPEYFDGGCQPEILWDPDDPNGCGFVQGFTGMLVTGDPPPLPVPVARQFVDQLVVDGEPVRRALADGKIAAFRETAGCARLERIHLGTGEVVASSETCPSPELAMQLGPHTLDPMLRCDDGRTCAGDDTYWTDLCLPVDPGSLPEPATWLDETRLDPACPDANMPFDGDPAPDPPTTGPTSAGSSSGDASEDSAAEDPASRGCACDLDGPSGGLLPLLVLLWWRRR